jgi:hypothetical protein
MFYVEHGNMSSVMIRNVTEFNAFNDRHPHTQSQGEYEGDFALSTLISPYVHGP